MKRLALTLAITALIFDSDPSLGQVTLRTVATIRSQAPNFPTGVVYAGFGAPTINDSGQVAFSAQLIGPGVPQQGAAAVFVADEDTGFRTPVLSGEQVVGLPEGVRYESFDDIKINNSGAIAFPATLTGLGVDSFHSSRAVITHSKNAGATAVISYGDPVPGLPEGSVIDRIGYYVDFNERGQVAFEATTSAPGSWQKSSYLAPSSNTGLTTVARSGDLVNLLPQGVRYDALWTRLLNDQGDLAYIASISNPDTPNVLPSPIGLFVHRVNTASTSVLMSGDQAAGFPNGVKTYISNYSFPSLNNAGEVVLRGSLFGDGITPTALAALLSDVDGSDITAVARTGDQVPALDEGITYSSFSRPRLNDGGQIMFAASFEGDNLTYLNNGALFSRERNGEIAVIARLGDEAPGFSKRVTYTGFYEYSFRINNNGVTVFVAGLHDGDSTFDGLFMADENQNVHLVAAERHSLDFDDGVPGESTSVAWLRDPYDLSNTDELAFGVHFSNAQERIFVASLPVSVPEPATVVLAAIACFCTLRRPTTAC